MSTEFVIAHSPMPFGMGAPHPALRVPFPSQHCDLRFKLHCDLRFKLHCDLRSSAEGSVAHQNFYVNITRARRNRILTIGIRISRQCPPQARPMVAPAFFFPLRINSRARRDEARRSATKHDEARRRANTTRFREKIKRRRLPPLYFCAVGKFHLYLVASMRTAKTHSAAVSME